MSPFTKKIFYEIPGPDLRTLFSSSCGRIPQVFCRPRYRADVEERLEEDELVEVLSDIDGVIYGDDRFTDHAMASAPRLKVISKWGAGIDSIDRAAAASRHIRICRISNAFTEPVANTVPGVLRKLAPHTLCSIARDLSRNEMNGTSQIK
ncbi:hypothetical protein OAJ77_00530 [Rhodospirillales bacterium]|nr:hypothetical protein [Rhodospirillales bacterium]